MSETFNMPWFKFWVGDFITSRRVAALTMEEVGVYVMLLCNEWKDGPLPDNPELLARMIRTDPNTVRGVLEQCFSATENGWENERLEAERDAAREKHQKRVKAGKASGRARRKRKGSNENEHRSNNVRAMHQQSTKQSESESESESEKKRGEAAPERGSDTAAAVEFFLDQVGAEWSLGQTVEEWSDGLATKYAGVDVAHEVQRCAEWHVERGKKPKAPTSSIHNWLKRAADDVKPAARRTRTGQDYARLLAV